MSKNLQELLFDRVSEIILEERKKSDDDEWTIVQDGIQRVDSEWVLVLVKQNKRDYTLLKYYKIVEL